MDDFPFKVYEDSIRYVFKYHPRCEHIIEAMRTSQLTTDEIDILFAEAEMCLIKYYKNLKMPESDENGMVTFKVAK